MMEGELDAEAEVADDLEGVYQAEPEHAVTGGREFAPWHHPRKQFVRIKQWCAEVNRLIPMLGLAQGDPFRYLTLPGNELLDVRALHGVVQSRGVTLRYTGFKVNGPAMTAAASVCASA